MLKFLNITNIAVIHRLGVELHAGLNLLTGETGAGKSIIVDALVLLLGRRGGAELIRTGEKTALIEGIFEVRGADHKNVADILSGVGIDLDSDELIVRREISTNGRNRIFINDQSVTVSTIKALQPFLVDVLGQGDQQTLGASQTHLEMLDNFARCNDLKADVAKEFSRWRKSANALSALKRDEAERERLLDYLRYQFEEIDKFQPRAGEDVELTSERALLAHAERAMELCASSYAELYENDESILAELGVVRRRIDELTSIDRRIESWSSAIEEAAVLLNGVAEDLREYAHSIDFSPDRLGEIETRLAELERLKRKYGCDLEGLIRLKSELQSRLAELEVIDIRKDELLRELRSAEVSYMGAASRLSEARRRAAPELEKLVTEELRHLAMERANFIVSVETPSGVGEGELDAAGSYIMQGSDSSHYTPYGVDKVEFLLSANQGELPRPLARVASGGELSRLMLSLRTICRTSEAREDEPSDNVTLIFDEVDAGIGGKTAEAVGRRLKALAARQQVLCVTHQAQIARFADHHYAVTKQLSDGRTVASVRELSQEEKVSELARMIGGAEEIETARETARWMLESGLAHRDELKHGKTVKVKSTRKKQNKVGAPGVES